ncbi:MAG TPA: competence/damage-inducible protein A [Holosporales bacterium]|nr:competence/damage-inducible protein A [Holosporales bacterium]
MSEQIITAAILIIGDEILSGRTQDTNTAYITNTLAEKGIDILEVRIIKDDEAAIIFAVNELRSKYTYLFTTGGIGGTHDDITTPSIAKALNLPLVENTKARKIIEDRYGMPLNAHFISMTLMPKGAHLIANSLSKVPSFYIDNVYVLAGMPSVMKVMLDDIIPKLQSGEKIYSNTLTSGALEGMISEDLSTIQSAFTNVSIGSYPFYDDTKKGTTLVLRSRDTKALKQATKEILTMLYRYNCEPTMNFDIQIES